MGARASQGLGQAMNANPFTTTLKIKTRIGKLYSRVKETGAAFDAAWSEYTHTHSKDARQKMMDAHKAFMAALGEYDAELKKRNARELQKLEGIRP
jgi:hypothetical protein